MISGFLPQHTLAHTLLLEGSCRGQPCSDDMTCRGGRCEDAIVDPAVLPGYVPVGLRDAGVIDAGRRDAGPRDAGVDGAAVDAGHELGDAGLSDAGQPDACRPTVELCNERDDDCDGDTDESCPLACVSPCGDRACAAHESCLRCADDCSCAPSGCGNAVREAGEECDDGNRSDTDLCTTACAAASVLGLSGAFSSNEEIGMAATGETVVVTSKSSSSDASVFRRFDTSGVAIDAVARRASAGLGGVEEPVHPVFLMDGSLLVLFGEDRQVRGRRFRNDCDATSSSVSDDVFPDLSFELGVDHDFVFTARSMPAGGFIVVWTSSALTSADTSGSAVYALRFDDSFRALDASPILVNSTTTGDQRHPSVAVHADGSLTVAFQDASASARARRFDATGAAVGDDFVVGPTAGLGSPVFVDALPGGGFVVAWTCCEIGARDVYYRRYDSRGASLDGSPMRANAATAGTQGLSCLATNDRGAFLVGWSDARGCDSGCSGEQATYRIFAPDGTPLMDESAIPDAGPSGPAGALGLGDGSFLVSFSTGGDTWIRRVDVP